MSQAIPIPEVAAQDDGKLAGTPLPTHGQSLDLTALQSATMKFHDASDWVAFYREVLGAEGLIRKLFAEEEEFKRFERTAEYAQIQQMLTKLRQRKDEVNDEEEPTRVITVRLPKSIHESLKKEAYHCQTSMNKLCISKLVQFIDNGLVPSD
jgi:predicted HicB family RNase H-like nuclease